MEWYYGLYIAMGEVYCLYLYTYIYLKEYITIDTEEMDELGLLVELYMCW